jgi:hypothetical protein
MRMNYTDIKGDILDHWEQLAEMAYPDDLLRELADSACPVYYSDIMTDWQEMPNEFTDQWQEFVEATQDTTIFSLMSADLFNYYDTKYTEVYNDIKTTKEEESNE